MEKEIENLRRKLDKITQDLISLLAKRNKIVLEIGKLKRKKKILIFDKKREREILEMAEKVAKERGLNPILVKKIIKLLIDDAKRIQRKN